MAKNLLLSPSPHTRTKETVDRVMLDVVLAMLPIIGVSIYYFGQKALITILISIVGALFFEALSQKLMKQKIRIMDGSAMVTGILFAFTLPPTLPWWATVAGIGVAIVLGKMVFGGLGHNIFNPALVGRAFVLSSWGALMVGTDCWIDIDGKAGATVLGILKESNNMANIVGKFGSESQMYMDMFLGKMAGSLGETSALAILIGGIYLLIRKQITWHIPVSYIGTVAILTAISGQDPLFHILSGGLMLGAFFMATDMVTSPYTNTGKLIFGIGGGILVVAIRLKGGYPEGVCYSILIMNGATPLINHYVRPKVFGGVKIDEKNT